MYCIAERIVVGILTSLVSINAEYRDLSTTEIRMKSSKNANVTPAATYHITNVQNMRHAAMGKNVNIHLKGTSIPWIMALFLTRCEDCEF